MIPQTPNTNNLSQTPTTRTEGVILTFHCWPASSRRPTPQAVSADRSIFPWLMMQHCLENPALPSRKTYETGGQGFRDSAVASTTDTSSDRLTLHEAWAGVNLQHPAWHLAKSCWVSQVKQSVYSIRVSNGALPWCWPKYHYGCCTSTFAAEAALIIWLKSCDRQQFFPNCNVRCRV